MSLTYPPAPSSTPPDGLDPTVVSPAAKSVSRGEVEHSCRARSVRRGSHAPRWVVRLHFEGQFTKFSDLDPSHAAHSHSDEQVWSTGLRAYRPTGLRAYGPTGLRNLRPTGPTV